MLCPLSDKILIVFILGPYEKLKNTEIITTIIQEDRAENCAFWNYLFPKLLKVNWNTKSSFNLEYLCT